MSRGSFLLFPTGRCNTEMLSRHKLLARIRRRYATVTREMRFGQAAFAFTRVADPDRVLDEVAEEADRRQRATGVREADEHLHLPYWAELWDSALGVGQFLAKRPPTPGGSVLDLGCGMGLSGTVAAALGARVLFADIETPALLFARLNSLPWAARVRTRRLDWRQDELPEEFDLILGADILYERAQWEYLEPFWQRHLRHDGTVLLAEPGRQTGDAFERWILSRKWRWTRHEETVTTRIGPIRLLLLTRPTMEP